MLTIDALRTWGANVNEGLERCMNMEAFYLRLVPKAVEDANFEKLPEAVAAGDMEKAFEAAHALKGSCRRTGEPDRFDEYPVTDTCFILLRNLCPWPPGADNPGRLSARLSPYPARPPAGSLRQN